MEKEKEFLLLCRCHKNEQDPRLLSLHIRVLSNGINFEERREK